MQTFKLTLLSNDELNKFVLKYQNLKQNYHFNMQIKTCKK